MCLKMNVLPVNPKLRLDSEFISLINEIDKNLAGLNTFCTVLDYEDNVFNLLVTSEAIASINIDSKTTLKFSDYFKANDELNKKITRYYSSINFGNLLKNISKTSHIIKSIYSELSGEEENILGEIKYRDGNVFDLSNEFNSSSLIALPAPAEIPLLMQNLDEYSGLDISYPLIINAAIIHGQFEMIHPFNSHNGLTGRLHFHLLLKSKNRLVVPILQISPVLYKKKQEYFERLLDLEKNNSWEGWIKFVLLVINEAVFNTRKLLGKIFKLRKTDLEIITTKEIISTSLLKFYNYLFKKPIFTIPDITKDLGYSKQTANIIVSKLMDEKIITETTGQQRYRIYSYKKLVDILENESDS